MSTIEQLREVLVGFDAAKVHEAIEHAEQLERTTGDRYEVPLMRQPRVSTAGWTEEMLANELPPPETTLASPAALRQALSGMARNPDGRLCLLSKYTSVRG